MARKTYLHNIRYQISNGAGNMFIINDSNTSFTASTLMDYIEGLDTNTPIITNSVYAYKPVVYIRSAGSNGMTVYYTDGTAVSNVAISSFTAIVDIIIPLN